MSLLSKGIPHLYKIKDVSRGLNSSFDIVPAPGGLTGVQQSLRTRLLVWLNRLTSLCLDDVIRVKLSGDGTAIGRNVNVTFTLLNEGTLAQSSSGNHSLAILRVPEKYDSLSKALRDISDEASNLQSVTINEVSHTIEYYLGGDMKFLACGIDAATSEHACMWCKCSNTEQWDMDKE